jgi:hypothetical protein
MGMSMLAEHCFAGLSLGILILKLDTYSSISLRVGVTLTKMMLYSGPTEVFSIY